MALQTGRPVLDQTELVGEYDFTLFFDPRLLRNSVAAPGSDPDIFAAVQEQLGLKLDARKTPVEILVIDSADKVPTQPGAAFSYECFATQNSSPSTTTGISASMI